MNIRNFKDDAYEFTRQHGQPGDVSLVRKAMEFGWDRGMMDATTEIHNAITKVSDKKLQSTLPQ
jgi:hypothetical protein